MFRNVANRVVADNQYGVTEQYPSTAQTSTDLTSDNNDFQPRSTQAPPPVQDPKESIFRRTGTILRKSLYRTREKNSSKTIITVLIIVILVGFLIGFIVYFYVSPESFAVTNDESSPFVNGLYYWTTTTSTVGFGDICPKTTGAKVLTSIYQIVLVILSMGGVFYFTDGRLKKAFADLKTRLPTVA